MTINNLGHDEEKIQSEKINPENLEENIAAVNENTEVILENQKIIETNKELQIDNANHLKEQLYAKDEIKKTPEQELWDKIFLQMDKKYDHIIPNEQKEKLRQNEEVIFNKLYETLVADLKTKMVGNPFANSYGYGYMLDDPIVMNIMKESNFVWVDGKIDNLRMKVRLNKLYKEDSITKPDGIKWVFKSRKWKFPYSIRMHLRPGDADEKIWVSVRMRSPKEERKKGKSKARYATH